MNLPKFLFLPYWVYNQLERNNIPLATVGNNSDITKVVSTEDLITADIFSMFMVSNIIDIGFTGSCYDISGQSIYMLNGVSGNINKDAMNNPEYTELIKKNIFDRLFAKESKMDRYTSPFKVVPISNELSVVVIYPGYFTGNVKDVSNLELEKQLVIEMIDTLYVFAPIYEVAKTSLYHRYLELVTGMVA